MTRKKKELSPNRQLAQAIIDQYQPQSVEDMQDALKDILGSMFEAMLQGEMNSHLGYSNNERGEKDTVNRRNGYTKKTWKTTVGDAPIGVLDAADQEEEAGLLSEAYEHLICAYQEAREINDELEELLKNAFMN